MIETIYSEETQKFLDKCDELLSDYAKEFEARHSHFKPHEYQKAWLNDETRSAILYAKSRVVSLSIPKLRVIADKHDSLFEIRDLRAPIPAATQYEQSNKREHGWYNKFNKTNKRKKFASK